MRVEFIQNLIDKIKGKEKSNGTTIPCKVFDNHDKGIDVLFDKFDFSEFEINGKQRKYLSNVNADHGVTEQTLSLLTNQFPKERNSVKVLNIGCGKKDQMLFLNALEFDAYGIDFDIDVDTSRIKFHDLNTQDDIPFDEKYFDCVICQEIIEHIENPWLLMRKVKRVLKVGGSLIVTTPNICSNQSKKVFARNNLGFFAYFNPENLWQHINPIPYWEMHHLLNFNGLEIEKISGCNEYYVKYIPIGKKISAQLNIELTIQNNNILHYVTKNINSDIKLYSPIPTYDYIWPGQAQK
jgi:SAM-dependent methyltransferase